MKSTYLYQLYSIMLIIACNNLQAEDTIHPLKNMKSAKEIQKSGLLNAAECYSKQVDDLSVLYRYKNVKHSYLQSYDEFLYKKLCYHTSLNFVQQVITLSMKFRNQSGAAAVYNNILLQLRTLKQLVVAAKFHINGFEITSSIQHTNNLGLNDREKYNNSLSSMFLDLSNDKSGLNYAQKTIGLASKLNEIIGIRQNLASIVVAEIMSNDLDSAELNAINLLKIARDYNDIEYEINVHTHLGIIYRKQHRYLLALRSFKSALQLLSGKIHEREIYILSEIVSVYNEMKDFDHAEKYFQIAMNLAEVQFPNSQVINLYLLGSEIKEGKKKYREAFLLYKKYHFLADSLKNGETHKAVEDLKQLNLKLEKLNRVKENFKVVDQKSLLEINNKWFIISITIILIVGCLCIYLLTVNRIRRRKMNILNGRRLLEAKLKGEEDERARTAKELHDGVASVLSAAKIQIHNAIESDPSDKSLHQIGELIELSAQEIRNISHNLAPEFLLSEGLVYAIKSFCSRVRGSMYSLDFYQIGSIPCFGKSVELVIYRTVQEAVTNMVKHSGATKGIVQLEGIDGLLRITVEDNGCGFDKDVSSKHGLGLNGLSCRISNIGGKLDIKSLPGKGTSIYIEIDGAILSAKKKQWN